MDTIESLNVQNLEGRRNEKIIMKKCLFVFFFTLFFSTMAEAVVRYVTTTGNGSEDGSSWENATQDLQAMINISTSGDMIWVAQGKYYPMHSAANWSEDNPTEVNSEVKDRYNSFILKSGIQVYGGFTGVETKFEERDWMKNRTILSGDFDDNDEGNNPSSVKSLENAYHVVISVDNEEGTILDGFTIWGGGDYYFRETPNPNPVTVNGKTISSQHGGGIYADNSAATIRNLEIRRNAAYVNGGGLYCINSPDFRGYNLYFFKNFASQGGGIFVNDHSRFKNVILSENEAGIGAGISNSGKIMYEPYYHNVQAKPHYVNVVVHSNYGSPHNGLGAGIQNERASPTLTNVTIIGNFGGKHAGMYNYYDCNPVVNNSIIWNNMATDGNVENVFNSNDCEGCEIIYNNSLVQGKDLTASNGLDASDPEFDPMFISPPAYAWYGGLGSFTLQPGSPCIGTGNSELYKAACGEDFNGWENEYTITPPPYTNWDDSSDDFFGAWYPKDIYSGKQAYRLQKNKINIGAFEAPFTPTVHLSGCSFGEELKPYVTDCPEGTEVLFYYSKILKRESLRKTADTETLSDWSLEKPSSAGAYLVQARITIPNHGTVITNPVQFNIAKSQQSINFQPETTLSVEDGPYILTASATSGLPVCFKVDDNQLAEIKNGNQLILKKPGTINVTAYLESNENYEEADEVTVQITLDFGLTILNKISNDSHDLFVSPNPVLSGDIVQIKLPSSSKIIQNIPIEVYNITGQFVQYLFNPKGTEILEVSVNLLPGSYILKWGEYKTKLMIK